MKLTLKQARRVEREIGAELDKETRASGRRTSVSIYEDLREKVNGMQKQIVNDVYNVKELLRIRFALRKAIETANETSGLNALMNREAELKALAKVLSDLMGTELSNEDLDIAAQRHAAAKAAAEKGTPLANRYGQPTDEVDLDAVMRTETLEQLRDLAKAVQRELLTVVDAQGALNVGTAIVLSDDDAQAVEANGIVL